MTQSANQQPLVSVIVPAFNAERFIAHTLRSAQSQTYSNLEIIVVDDGSRDCTPAIVEEFADRDPRIRLLRQQNLGVAAARNLAIEQARGEFVAPLDADDIWFPAKIAQQVVRLQKAGERAGMAYAWSVSIDEQGRILDAGSRWMLEGNAFHALVLRNFIGNASVPLFRRSVLERVGGYDESLRARDAQGCEDWELSLRVAERYDLCAAAEYLVGYRCYAESMSYSHAAMGRSYALVMDAVRRKHPEIPDSILRWSKSIFYLYLTHKSNASGDLRSSLVWLSRALRQDPAILLLPWVCRCLANRLLRWMFYAVTKDHRAWQQLRRHPFAVQPLTFEEAVQRSIAQESAARLWDRLQWRRWRSVVGKNLSAC